METIDLLYEDEFEETETEESSKEHKEIDYTDSIEQIEDYHILNSF